MEKRMYVFGVKVQKPLKPPMVPRHSGKPAFVDLFVAAELQVPVEDNDRQPELISLG